MAEPTLDDVFNDETGATADPVPPTESEPEPEPAPVEEPTEEPEPEPETPEAKTREDAGMLQAMLDEREKRQNLERELKALKEQQTAPEQPKADPIDDPDGFREQMEQEMRLMRYEMQREMMAERYDDWSDAEAWIDAQLPNNAAMAAKLQGSSNVLKDAYAMYQQHKQLEEMGDVEAVRERIRAEERAKLLEEMQSEQAAADGKAAQAAKAASKPSLATTGTSAGAGELGEETLEDVIGESSVRRRKR